jgi:hypothetical protein
VTVFHFGKGQSWSQRLRPATGRLKKGRFNQDFKELRRENPPSKIKLTPYGGGIYRSATKNVCDVLVAQAKLQEALEVCQQALTIAKKLLR